MKKFCISLLLLASAAFAQSSLTLSIQNQGPIRAGNTLQLQANLTGATAAGEAAFQFNLRATVPGTWTIQPGVTATAAGKQFTCVSPDAVNPDFHCILAGINANTIQDGIVATISLAIPANVPDGQVSVIPSNLLGASGVGSTVALTANTLNFTLASPLSPCDVNSDDVTNVQDVQLVGNQVLGLVAATTDLDNDGKTTIVDYQRVVNAANGSACKLGK